MEWVETTGKTLEEAQEAALDQLGVDHEDAEFEVLEEAKLGLFGRVRAEARVRARVRPATPRPKEDQRNRRRRGGGGNAGAGGGAAGGGGPGGSGGAGAAADEAPVRRDRRRERPAEPQRARAAAGGAAEASGASGRTAGDQSGNGRGSVDVPLLEQAEVGRSFLGGLVESFGLTAEVTVSEIDEDTVELRVDGEGLGLLIGPRGNTLLAIQDLTRTAVQRRTGGANGRLLVDVAGYRSKRRAALERFTRDQAERVLASGQRLVLEPMVAADRKVVHDTANGIEGIATLSEGEEPQRRVVLLPAAGTDSA